MKKKLIISILSFAIIFMFSAPSMALSPRAEEFVKACYTLDAPFPPAGWDELSLQDAAIEVLDTVESGHLNPELINFCIIAIGYVGDPNELHRVMEYKDSHEFTVLRGLKGFSHRDAINHLLNYLNHEEIPQRELAAMSLGSMDFNKLDKPMDWYQKVRGGLVKTHDNEETDWLKDYLQSVIDKLKIPDIQVN